jgi:hypothetical protein
VTLERNAEGGTTAKVFIPRALLAAASALEPVADDASAAVAESVAPVSVLGETTFRRPEVEVDVEEPPGAVPEREDTVAREETPAAPSGNPLDALSAVINANIRLPQRQPGTAAQPSELTPVLSVDTPRTPLEREPVPDGEAVAEPVDEPVVAASSEPEVADDEVAEHVAELDDEPVEEPAAASEPVEEVAADEEPERVPAFDFPTRSMSVVRDLTPSPEPARNGVAKGEDVVPVLRADPLLDKLTSIPTDDEDSTPLYQLLRSSWFSTEGATKGWDSGEADAGWQAADRANETAPSRLSRSGLPVRDPGNRLVPGGVTTATSAVRRDPEAIRARLAAHAAGVAKGRQASGTDHTTLDTTEDVTP